MKERLNTSENCFGISLFRRNNILLGILFGPEALLELREDIMLIISSVIVGCRNIVLLLSFKRWPEKCSYEYLMLFVVSTIESKKLLNKLAIA